MRYFLILFIGCVLLGGCQNTEPDPRPPLMNTNSFTNFRPYYLTNEILIPDEDNLDLIMGNIIDGGLTNKTETTNGIVQ